MSHNHHQHSIMPDVQGLLLVAGSWVPTVLTVGAFSGIVKVGMFALSGILTVLAIIDYLIKIRWKLGQKKASKRGESHHQVRERQLDELIGLMKAEKDAAVKASIDRYSDIVDDHKGDGYVR